MRASVRVTDPRYVIAQDVQGAARGSARGRWLRMRRRPFSFPRTCMFADDNRRLFNKSARRHHYIRMVLRPPGVGGAGGIA